MSAFIVSTKHIDFLLAAYVRHVDARLSQKDLSEIGQMLLNENYESVNYRYRQNDAARSTRPRASAL